MAIQAVGWVLEHENTTSGAERLVLLSLANHAGLRQGVWECYPSIETIAREAGIARHRTVQSILARLVDRGLILRAINAAPDSRIRGDRRPNLYSLVCIPHGLSGNGTPLTHGVTLSDPRGDAFRPDGVTPSDTQTIIEPSVNLETRVRRATRIPDDEDWTPPGQSHQYALDRGLDPSAELEKFRDYHLARGSAMKDWGAAWRTWCRNAVTYRQRDGTKAKPGESVLVDGVWMQRSALL